MHSGRTLRSRSRKLYEVLAPGLCEDETLYHQGVEGERETQFSARCRHDRRRRFSAQAQTLEGHDRDTAARLFRSEREETLRARLVSRFFLSRERDSGPFFPPCCVGRVLFRNAGDADFGRGQQKTRHGRAHWRRVRRSGV